MEKIDGVAVRNKILSLLRIRGPSLPIHLAREINLSVLFTSAFLSELSSNKEIKLSNMKVGSSPLYFVSGQEPQLENFSKYLSGKEKEAFLLLKDKKFLQDTEQEPAIRVALRALKDFAFPAVIEEAQEKKLFWRYLSLAEEDAKKLIQEAKIEKIKPEIKTEENQEKKIEEAKPEATPEMPAEEIQEIKVRDIEKEARRPRKERERPLISLSQKQKPQEKEKSEFVKKILSFLQAEDIEILEEKAVQKKEFYAVVRVNSGIGKIKLLAVCKDKKKISENDFAVALQKAQSLKIPVFFLSTGSLDKKAESYLQDYEGLIKFKSLKS